MKNLTTSWWCCRQPRPRDQCSASLRCHSARRSQHMTSSVPIWIFFFFLFIFVRAPPFPPGKLFVYFQIQLHHLRDTIIIIVDRCVDRREDDVHFAIIMFDIPYPTYILVYIICFDFFHSPPCRECSDLVVREEVLHNTCKTCFHFHFVYFLMFLFSFIAACFRLFWLFFSRFTLAHVFHASMRTKGNWRRRSGRWQWL